MPAKHPDERRGPMDEREDGAPDVEDADCDFCGETDLPVAVSEHASRIACSRQPTICASEGR